jgi:hypothetical protein
VSNAIVEFNYSTIQLLKFQQFNYSTIQLSIVEGSTIQLLKFQQFNYSTIQLFKYLTIQLCKHSFIQFLEFQISNSASRRPHAYTWLPTKKEPSAEPVAVTQRHPITDDTTESSLLRQKSYCMVPSNTSVVMQSG